MRDTLISLMTPFIREMGAPISLRIPSMCETDVRTTN
jgi:hypothetical protein